MTIQPAKAAQMGDHIYRGTTAPATIGYAGFLDVGLAELTGGGYSRMPVGVVLPAFNPATGGSISEFSLVFPQRTETSVQAHYIAFWDSPTGGVPFDIHPITPTVFAAGKTPRIPAGDLSITIEIDALTPARSAAIGDHIFRNAADTATEAYIGLAAADGTTELTGSGYARPYATPVLPVFDEATGETVSNADLDFPTATVDWAQAHYVLFFAAASGGVPYAKGLIVDSAGDPAPVTVTAGRFLTFEAGTITLKMRQA